MSASEKLKALREPFVSIIDAETLVHALPQLLAVVEAAEQADRLASVAHDAIWDKTVEPAQIIYDDEYETSAQSAIWKLHETVRPALAALDKALS